ncbi:MAG: hypothetical protein ISS66_03620 [Desulfobacteraceae bacterium]|nr:hypothetical protein [Desulfobacteraceae bacterium]
MIVLELLVAFIVALVLSGLFALTTRRRDQRIGFPWFFLIVFLVTWAGGIGVKPFGPSLFGISWIPFVLVGFIFILILAASTPRRPPKSRHETLDMLERIDQKKKMDQFTYISLSALFGILLFILIVAIIIRYLL